jgi:hypothetical protein
MLMFDSTDSDTLQLLTNGAMLHVRFLDNLQERQFMAGEEKFLSQRWGVTCAGDAIVERDPTSRC